MLAPSGVLVEHALADEQEHEQPARQRGLHDHERRQQQRHDLQREAEHRQARSRQPARPPGELADQTDTQMVPGIDLTRIERLQGDA